MSNAKKHDSGAPKEAVGRLSVLDMNDRLGVEVPYRACWRQL